MNTTKNNDERIFSVFFTLLIYIVVPLSSRAQTINIAAAANLRYVMDDIIIEYKKHHPQVNINISYSASGALTTQIINGANVDVFFSANVFYPNQLKSMELTEGEVYVYAYGKLALWSSELNLSKGIEIINSEEVKKIAIANPFVAPLGESSVQCMKYYNLFEANKKKLVYADNVAQAAQFAQSGNAEIAFIAYSLIYRSALEKTGSYYLLDTNSYPRVEQACVVIKKKVKNPESEKFTSFILSNRCKLLFNHYGFDTP